jgi:hypothetical protein
MFNQEIPMKSLFLTFFMAAALTAFLNNPLHGNPWAQVTR